MDRLFISILLLSIFWATLGFELQTLHMLAGILPLSYNPSPKHFIAKYILSSKQL
jgi:hypothetical protein